MKKYKKNSKGLITLVKSKPLSNKKKKDKKKDSKTPYSYNKKKDLLRKLEQMSGKYYKIEDFHETELNNFILYNNDMMEVFKFKGKPKKDMILKLKKEFPDSKVLINTGNDGYKMIPFSAYIKLSKISKIVISREFREYSPDWDEEDEEEFLIPVIVEARSINELLNFLHNEETYKQAIRDLTAREYWYTTFNVHYKILIEKKNGNIIYYKDLYKFMKSFKLLRG